MDTDTSKRYKLPYSYGIEYSDLSTVEGQIFRKFYQGIHHYVDRPPESDYLQWLALMQHHGVPTRLLDVTRSIFVALYFAVSHDDDTDGALYSFSWIDCNQFHLPEPSQVSEPKTLANHYLEPVFQKSLTQEWATHDIKSNPGVLNVKPLALNRRQIAQQGEFLMPIRVDKSFEENLASTHTNYARMGPCDYGDSRVPTPIVPVIKYVIPRPIFANVRITLLHMNITAASLFPDLEGYAQSMHEIPQRWRDGNY